MSFLIASGHVEVTANTREAEQSVERFVDKMRQMGTVGARAFDQVDQNAKELARTLGRLKTLGNVRLRADLDDRAGAGIAAMRASIQDLQRQNPVQLRARFSGDTAQLIAMAQAMRDLRDDTTRTGTPLTGLATRSAAAAAALQLLDNAAGDASRSLRTLRGRAAATADAMRDLRDTMTRAGTAMNTFANRAQTADGRLNTLSGNTRTLRGDLDDLDGSLRRVGGSMGALRPSLGSLGSGGSGSGGGLDKLMQAALLLSPALIPIGASLTAIAAGAAAAGAGVAAFGVAVAGQVKDLSEASQAQTQYDKAVREFGRGSAQAAEAQLAQQRVLAGMPAATREAAAAFSVLKDEYREWSDALSADTMPVVTKSFAAFGALLPRLTPLVQGTSRELERLVTVAAGGIESGAFDDFMNKFADFAEGSLRKATDGMVSFARAMSEGTVDSSVAEFMAYARENGPLVGETLKNLASALAHLLAAASDVGVSILTVANSLAKMVNAIPTEALSTLLQFAVAFKAVQLAAAGFGGVSGAMAAFSAQATAAAAASTAAGGGLAGLAAGFAALSRAAKVALVGSGIGILVVAMSELAEVGRSAPPDVDKLTNSLRQLGAQGQVTGEAAKHFGSDLDGLYGKVRSLTDPSTTDKVQQFIVTLGGLGNWDSTPVKEASENFDAIDNALAGLVKNGQADLAAAALKRLKAEYAAGGGDVSEFTSRLEAHKDALANAKLEQQLAADAMGIFGQQALETGRQLNAQKTAADGLRQALINLNDTNRAAYDAQLAFEQGIDDLTAAFKTNGATLDEHTDAGRRNGEAMSNVSKRHDEMIVAALAAGDSMASMQTRSEGLRAEMMRLATQAFKGNTKAATEYVNRLLGTPESVKTTIKLERQAAITGLKEVQAEIQKTPGAKSVKVTTLNAAAIKALEDVGYKTRTLEDGRTEVFTKNGQAIGSIGAVRKALDNLNGKTARTYTEHYITNYTQQRNRGYEGNSATGAKRAGGATGGRYTGAGFRTRYATGGRVQGPGTGTSDDVLAPWLSNGEWVIRAEAVRKYGDRFLSMVNDGTLKLGAGFAKGGKISKAEKDARKSATPDLTISHFGRMAGYKTTEFAGDMARPDSLADLVGTLNGWRNKIKAATHGSSEAKLLKQLDGAGKALLGHEKRLAGVNKALEGAKDKLDDLKGKFDQLKTSVSSSLVSFGNITKIGKYGTSPETLIKQLSMDAGRTTEFAKQLEALKAKGLNATAIADIAGAGVTGGGMATAQSLLTATPEQIKHINELQKQLETSANKAGTTTADAMYGAGVKAAEGLVKGLTSQQKAIEAAMMAIAKGMEKSLKAALGIKSPAKLMEPIGEFSAMGVEVGWTKRLTKGNTLLSGNTAGLRTRPALMTGASGGAATATMAPVVNLTVNVSSNDLLTSSAKRKAFADLLAKETNDALLTYQKGRRR